MSVSSPSQLRGYQIGDAARQSGVNPANIRFYEKEKLLSPHEQGDNSYRLYSGSDVHQLRFIRLCRAMDMSFDEVRTLLGLDLNNKTDCAAARDALDGHLGHVRGRLADAQAAGARCHACGRAPNTINEGQGLVTAAAARGAFDWPVISRKNASGEGLRCRKASTSSAGGRWPPLSRISLR